MQALLIRNVDREDGWVSGFAVVVPDRIRSFPAALELPEVKKAIKEYDWKTALYADKIIDVDCTTSFVITVIYSNHEDQHEVTYGFDFIEVMG